MAVTIQEKQSYGYAKGANMLPVGVLLIYSFDSWWNNYKFTITQKLIISEERLTLPNFLISSLNFVNLLYICSLFVVISIRKRKDRKAWESISFHFIFHKL